MNTKMNATIEEIYEVIKSHIIAKEYKVSAKINQTKLAQEFNVSRTPVVKALMKLTAEGLVDSDLNKGFYVHPLSIKELSELFVLREAIEIIAISDLVEHITKEQINELEMCFDLLKEASLIDSSNEKYREADIIFHRTILKFCSNTLVKRMDESFQILNRTFVAGLIRNADETIYEHTKIMEALRTKNRKLAILSMREHIKVTKNLLNELVNRLKCLDINTSNILIDDVLNKVEII